MKLVTHFLDPGEASAAKSRLCEAGVMAEIGVVDPHIIQPSKSGAERIGLWVICDDQLEDARLLLSSDHAPRRVTPPLEITESNSPASEGLPKTVKNYLRRLFT